MLCYCKNEIPDGGRRIDVAVTVDWGDGDLRDNHEKAVSFCSFRCVADWAGGLADRQDSRVVAEGS